MKVYSLEPSAEPAMGRNPAKVGGLPRPPGPAAWPACAQCRHPMRFLFQLPHRPEIGLDLNPYGALLVFQCENPDTACDSFLAHSGANAVLAVRGSHKPVTMSGELPRQSPYPELSMEVLSASEDPVALGVEPDRASDVELDAKERAIEEAPSSKIGGVPIWPQGPDVPTCCEAPMKFVAQLHGDTWGLNFGDGGTGFVFRCAKDRAHPHRFLWQAY